MLEDLIKAINKLNTVKNKLEFINNKLIKDYKDLQETIESKEFKENIITAIDVGDVTCIYINSLKNEMEKILKDMEE